MVWKLGSGVCFTTPLKPPAGQASLEPFLCLSGKAERSVPWLSRICFLSLPFCSQWTGMLVHPRGERESHTPPPFQRVLEFWKQPSNELCFQPFQKRGALLRDQLSDRVSALDEAASPAFLSLKTEVGELICTTANLATFDRDKPIQLLQSGCNEVRGNPHYFTQVAQTRSSTWQLPSNCPLQRQVSLSYKEWFQCRP